MPLCQAGPRITPTRAETRTQGYRRLAVAETDAERAKVLWQLVEDAQRGAPRERANTTPVSAASNVTVPASFVCESTSSTMLWQFTHSLRL